MGREKIKTEDDQKAESDAVGEGGDGDEGGGEGHALNEDRCMFSSTNSTELQWIYCNKSW